MAGTDRRYRRMFLNNLTQRFPLRRRKFRLVTRSWQETRSPDTCRGHAARLKG
jgi:hypothetical protein